MSSALKFSVLVLKLLKSDFIISDVGSLVSSHINPAILLHYHPGAILLEKSSMKPLVPFSTF